MSRRVREFRSSWSAIDPDHRNAILLIGGIGVVLFAAFLILAYGYFDSRSSQNDAILSVGNRQFDYAFMERRAKAELLRGRVDTSAVAQSIVDVIVAVEREEVTRRLGEKLGFEANEQEVEARMRERMLVGTEASREEFAAKLRDELLRFGLPYNEYRDIAKAEAIDKKLRDHFGTQISPQLEHVNLQLLRTDTKEAADKAKERLDNGDRFSFVVSEFSTAESKAQAGQLGWTPRGAQPVAIEDVAFTMPIGTFSGVIEHQQAFYIIQVDGRETRAPDEAAKAKIVDQSFDRGVLGIRDEVGSRLMLTQDQLQRLALTIQTSIG